MCHCTVNLLTVVAGGQFFICARAGLEAGNGICHGSRNSHLKQNMDEAG